MNSQAKLNSVKALSTRPASYWLMAAAVVLGYASLQLFLLFNLPLTYVEGINLQVSRFISQGSEPYTQIFSLSGPLFIWFIGWLGNLGLSISAMKLIFALFGALLLLNVALVAEYWLDRNSALTAIFLLGTAVTFLNEVGTVVAVIPATSFALLSSVMVQHYHRTNQLFWLILSGFISLTAIFISASAAVISFLTLLQLFFPKNKQTGSTSLKSISLWLAGAVGATFIGLWLTTPAILIDILLQNHVTLWRNLTIDLAANFGIIGQFLGFNIWLFLFAIYGGSQLYRHPHHPLWLVVIWGTISAGWLISQTTLNLVDTAILLPPLTIIAAWGFVQLIDHISKTYSYPTNYSPAQPTSQPANHPTTQPANHPTIQPSIQLPNHFIIFLILTFYILISYNRFDAYLLRDIDTETDFRQIQQRDEIAAFINEYTNADDCVIIDDAALAIVADRLPTPQLVGLSQARLNSGLLTDTELATLIIEGGCQVIVFSKREYHQHFNDVSSWVATNFPNQEEFLGIRINYQ